MMMMSRLKLVLIFGAALGLYQSFKVQNTNHLPSVVPQYNTDKTHGRQLTTPTPALQPNHGFDYFLFVLQWPAAFCNIQRSGKRKCKPDPPEHRHNFTVHGLWPQLNGTKSPVNCRTTQSMEDINLKKSEDDLLKYWPDLFDAKNSTASKQFLKYQWEKHGSCSSNEFTPQDYLEKTLKLAEKYAESIFDKLQEKKIIPDGTAVYQLNKLRERVKEITDKYPILKTVFNDSGHRLLLEIQLCVEKDGSTLMDCDELYRFAAP